ncbi:MAG: class I SAM-dependent methyltransferase [Acidimicrobiaceae bacterium]|nr:class I SAM-dependent methyltransferase [Acidimicrobiaceae bacterium]
MTSMETETERVRSLSLLPPVIWDLQHRSGVWRRRLAADDECRRYATLATVIEAGGKTGTTGTLLDLGCAHGTLLDHLDPEWHPGYLGIDISPAAIAAGQRAHAGSGARFVAADIRSWTGETTFDSIAFNEILYYFARPLSLVRRYAHWLSPGGAIYVSMYQPVSWRQPVMRARINQIWRGLADEFDLVKSVSVRDYKDAEEFRIGQISDPRHPIR